GGEAEGGRCGREQGVRYDSRPLEAAAAGRLGRPEKRPLPHARYAPARIGCYDGSTMFGTSAGQRQTPTDSFGARIPAQLTARSAALHAGPSEAARADAVRAGQWSVTKR